MIKIIGVLIVIFSGICLGFSKAAREQKKLEQGIDLKRMLYLLQSEIRYGFTPLPEAIASIANKTSDEWKPFLVQVSTQLSSRTEESFSSVWSHALQTHLKGVILEPKFLKDLYSMGETMGYLDKEMQEKTIGFAIEQLEEQIFQMKDGVIKNCKMYRSLGLSFSLLLIILLI